MAVGATYVARPWQLCYLTRVAFPWPQRAPGKAVASPLAADLAFTRFSKKALPVPDPIPFSLPPYPSPSRPTSHCPFPALSRMKPMLLPHIILWLSPVPLHQSCCTESQTDSGTRPWKIPNPRFLLPVGRCSLQTVWRRGTLHSCAAGPAGLPACPDPLEWAP